MFKKSSILSIVASTILVGNVFGGDTHLNYNFASKYTIENNGNLLALNTPISEVSLTNFISNLSIPTDATTKVYNSSGAQKTSGNLAKGDYIKANIKTMILNLF